MREPAIPIPEMINPGAPIVVLSDLDHIWLRAYLGFPDLGQVVLGQKMRVTTQAVPGRVFEGKVIRVSDQAEFTPKDVQTPDQRMKEVFWVKIGLDNGEGLLKPGMPADVVR
jgi:HlyD family secretion protein